MRHFHLTCVNHPSQRWMTKSIAWTVTDAVKREGYYNHSRNIFYLSEDQPECQCKADCLRLAPDETGIDKT